MKTKIIAILASVVVLVATSVSASATFTSSAEDKVTPTISLVTTQVGDYEVQDSDVSIVIMYDDFSSEDFADDFDAVIDAVEAADDIEDLVGSTGMSSPLVSGLYYVSISDDLSDALADNSDVELEFTLSNIGIDSGVSVLAYVYASDWSAISVTNNGDNSVTVTDAIGALMLVVDSTVVESPETNDQAINMFVIVSAASLFAAAGCFLVSRKTRQCK